MVFPKISWLLYLNQKCGICAWYVLFCYNSRYSQMYFYILPNILCVKIQPLSKNSISVHYAHTHIKNYTITHVLSIYKHNYYYEPPRRLLMTITQCNKRDLQRNPGLCNSIPGVRESKVKFPRLTWKIREVWQVRIIQKTTYHTMHVWHIHNNYIT